MVDSLCAARVTVAEHPDQELWPSHLSDMITDGFGSDHERTEQLNWSAANLLLALHALHAQARHLAQDYSIYRHRGKIRDVEAWIEIIKII